MYVFHDSKDGYTTHLYDSFVAGRGKGPCSNEQSVMTILSKREVKCLEEEHPLYIHTRARMSSQHPSEEGDDLLAVPSQVSHHPLVLLHTAPSPMCPAVPSLRGSRPASSPALAWPPLWQGCACLPGPPQLSVLPRCCVCGPPGAGVTDPGVGPDGCPLAVPGSGAGEPRGGMRPPWGLLPEALHPHLQALCPAAQPGPYLQQ